MKKLLFILIFLFIASSYAQQKYINVNGTSKLELNADEIGYNLQINVVEQSIQESKKKNDEYVNQLLNILKNNGISKDDIEVSPIVLGKNYIYNNRQREQNGYFARVNVSFVLKDLTKYYDLTDRLSTNDNFEITGSYYDISDYEAQNKKAYEDALKAAKDKAGYMCKTLGLTLGDVMEIDETGNPQPFARPFNTLSKEGSQNENPFGKVTISRSVRVKFAIK
jgi:uncharacterized protein